jgi:membrane-anchored mycosin MYCP
MPGRVLARTATALATVAVAAGSALAGSVVLGQPASALPGPPFAQPPFAQPAFGQQCAPPATVVVRQIPWAQQRLVPQRAWELSQGQGVVVAVIDSGVDARVPQLAGHVLPGIDIVNGKGGADDDCLGHGTFVAGIIAAQPAVGVGFAGVAPGARILPIRQTNNGQDGTGSGMAAAITAAVDSGAKVINISAASSIPSAQLQAAVAYARRRDVLIVAAADNQAKEGDPRSYPASYPGVLAVGAINQDGKRSDFSETGDFIDIVAPGAGVLSLGTGGSGHLVGDGTSFAAPFVAGVAALVRAYRPGLTADQVLRRLELTADHPGVALPDRQFGWGVVNPYSAVATVLPDEGGSSDGTAPAPLAVPRAAATDHTARDRSLLISLGGLVGLLLIGVLAVAIPRGQRRGWQPDRPGSPVGEVGTGKAGAGGAATGGAGIGKLGRRNRATTDDADRDRADRDRADRDRADRDRADRDRADRDRADRDRADRDRADQEVTA